MQKTKKDRKKKNGLFTMVNVIILASIVGYMVKHEFPQKDYFYKKSISKKQIRFDREHFLLSEEFKWAQAHPLLLNVINAKVYLPSGL